MKTLTQPIARKSFIEKIGKTVIETTSGKTVFAPGDLSKDPAILVNIRVNEVGDKFVATADSKTKGSDGKTPIYKKGDTVIRNKETYDFMALTGKGAATEFTQGAAAFGLQLNVVMQA